MYTTILFYMMLAGAVTRLVSAGMLAMMGRINLPAGLVLLSLAVALLGLGLVAKRCLGNLRLREIVSYHLTADVVSLVSIVVLHFYMVDISMIETLITGSVLSVLASVSVLFLAFRKKRYHRAPAAGGQTTDAGGKERQCSGEGINGIRRKKRWTRAKR